MKHGRNLTVNEKKHVKSFRLNPDNWLISKKKTDEWLIVHRQSKKTRVIPAP